MTRIILSNKLLNPNHDRVAEATVEIDPPPVGPAQIAGVTNRWGNIDLNMSVLSDGRHTVRITPAETSTDPVGPVIASDATPPDRIFRSHTFSITLSNGRVIGVHASAAGNNHGTARLDGANILAQLQPVWIASPNHGARGATVSMIIVHHTGGINITSAINQFLSGQTSAHYIIDRDGQIVKMVQDNRRANHAGRARWAGFDDINDRSIGIEIVHRTANYPEAQYTALTGLLNRILNAYPDIPSRNIIGHSDVGVNARGRLGRKSGCPGLDFDWMRLEPAGLGMARTPEPYSDSIYGGLFQIESNGAFRRGDNDDRRRFGGTTRPDSDITGNPVQQIQQDLTDIGYSLGTPDGDYGELTHYAVLMLQEHFFAGGHGHKDPDGRVDFTTARLIRSVLAGL